MAMIRTPASALTLGGVDLMGTDHTPGWWIEAQGVDLDLGNPQPIERTILSFLLDGSIVTKDSDDNREMTIRLVVEATNSVNLAAAEAALIAETSRANALTWTPPDNTGDFAGTPCVFDVVTSTPSFQFSDMGELFLKRVYNLTIKALPFARSAAQTTFSNAAPPGTTPVVVSIDTCTATTGWARSGSTGTVSGPTVLSGTIIASWANSTTAANPSATLTLTRTGLSVNMTSGGYVRVDYASSGDGRTGAQIDSFLLNGGAVTPAARNGDVVWLPFTGTLNSVAVSTKAAVTRYGKLGLTVRDVSSSDIPQDSTGARQRGFSVPVGGSVRTQGSFAIVDAVASALGSVLLYTTSDQNSAQPPLRAWRSTTVGDTSDTSLVSGFFSDLGTNHIFRVPIDGVSPGGYLLLARVKHATAATYTLNWQARTTNDTGGTILDTGQAGSAAVALQAATWTVATVGRMVLPTTRAGSTCFVRIDLSSSSGVQLDEAWLFNLDTGQLTWVEVPGPNTNRMFIDAPSLDSPVPVLTIGANTDRSDAFHPGTAVKSFGQHRLNPPSTNGFLVTSGSVAAALSLSYYSRWHTHVGG